MQACAGQVGLLAFISPTAGSMPSDISVEPKSLLQILKVDAEKLQQEITERTTPLVIDFYATWCGPCLLLAKELEKVRGSAAYTQGPARSGSRPEFGANCTELYYLYACLAQAAEQLGDRVKILKVDTDENPDLSNQLRVRSR